MKPSQELALNRLDQLHQWVAQQHPEQSFELSAASADASFRRYFRITLADGRTQIVMDAPPEHEDCRPFLKVAELFRQSGAHIPQVYAQDLEQGFLLLSDLGSTTYAAAITPENAANLYAEALGALACIQHISQPDTLPEYSREKLLQEMELFPVWYVARHKEITLTAAQTESLYAMFDLILQINCAEPKVYVHRDFHSRNLMFTEPNPGIIDFQDALYGPITYDLVSLFKDAYIEWDEELTLDWLVRYWQSARQIGLPVREDFSEFHRDYEFMGVQRHLKVLGIFARLYHRDGKEGYLKDMPLVMRYLRKTCGRYTELHPLLKLLNHIDPQEEQTGFSF